MPAPAPCEGLARWPVSGPILRAFRVLFLARVPASSGPPRPKARGRLRARSNPRLLARRSVDLHQRTDGMRGLGEFIEQPKRRSIFVSAKHARLPFLPHAAYRTKQIVHR